MADQVHMADVDAQFQRCRRDHDGEFSRLEPPLCIQPDLPGQAAVMRCDSALAQPLS